MSKAGGEAAADGDKKFIVSFSNYYSLLEKTRS
jgi:hypothetical protein